MPLRDWFDAKRRSPQPDPGTLKLSDDEICKLWTQCYNCRENLPTKALQANAHVCPKCGYHFRIGARARIALMADRFEEWDAELQPADPLSFTDTEPYLNRQADARRKSKLNDAVVTGDAWIGETPYALAVMDFAYMGGSMGSVVGEKITRMAERALERRVPLVVVCASGGARMQEGTYSLMQMVKTGAVLARLHEAGILYISILTEPTFGGVTASYGMLGDFIIAEEGARVGFAGRRVIEQTIHQKLPPDFQTAGYLLQYGQVDMVLTRHEMKPTLSTLFRLHQRPTAEAEVSAFSSAEALVSA